MVKKSVLVVDDEQGYRDMYVYLLTPFGIETTCAVNGEEGVQKVKERLYDLVIMDVHMPHMSGPEALKAIKKIRPEQKVIICSSSSDANYVFEKRAQEEGAIVCLFKPIDLSEIQLMLEKTLGPLKEDSKL